MNHAGYSQLPGTLPSGHMFFRMIRLDDCGTIGASLIEVYAKNPRENYKHYIDLVANHILNTEPRLPDGTISRYWPHENTIWADDLFMSVAFLARMGKLTGDKKYFDDAVHQVKQYYKYLWDAEKEIFYYYSSLILIPLIIILINF